MKRSRSPSEAYIWSKRPRTSPRLQQKRSNKNTVIVKKKFTIFDLPFDIITSIFDQLGKPKFHHLNCYRIMNSPKSHPFLINCSTDARELALTCTHFLNCARQYYEVKSIDATDSLQERNVNHSTFIENLKSAILSSSKSLKVLKLPNITDSGVLNDILHITSKSCPNLEQLEYINRCDQDQGLLEMLLALPKLNNLSITKPPPKFLVEMLPRLLSIKSLTLKKVPFSCLPFFFDIHNDLPLHSLHMSFSSDEKEIRGMDPEIINKKNELFFRIFFNHVKNNAKEKLQTLKYLSLSAPFQEKLIIMVCNSLRSYHRRSKTFLPDQTTTELHISPTQKFMVPSLKQKELGISKGTIQIRDVIHLTKTQGREKVIHHLRSVDTLIIPNLLSVNRFFELDREMKDSVTQLMSTGLTNLKTVKVIFPLKYSWGFTDKVKMTISLLINIFGCVPSITRLEVSSEMIEYASRQKDWKIYSTLIQAIKNIHEIKFINPEKLFTGARSLVTHEDNLRLLRRIPVLFSFLEGLDNKLELIDLEISGNINRSSLSGPTWFSLQKARNAVRKFEKICQYCDISTVHNVLHSIDTMIYGVRSRDRSR